MIPEKSNHHPREVKPPAEPLSYARLRDLRHIHATTLSISPLSWHSRPIGSGTGSSLHK
jgi:hypothetical protein